MHWSKRIEKEPSLGYRIVRNYPSEGDLKCHNSVIDQVNSVLADQPVDEVLVALPIDKYGPLVER